MAGCTRLRPLQQQQQQQHEQQQREQQPQQQQRTCGRQRTLTAQRRAPMLWFAIALILALMTAALKGADAQALPLCDVGFARIPFIYANSVNIRGTGFNVNDT